MSCPWSFQDLITPGLDHSRTWSFQDLIIPGLDHIHSRTWSFQDLIIPGVDHSRTWSFQDLIIPGLDHSRTWSFQDLIIPELDHSRIRVWTSIYLVHNTWSSYARFQDDDLAPILNSNLLIPGISHRWRINLSREYNKLQNSDRIQNSVLSELSLSVLFRWQNSVLSSTFT